MPRTVHANVCDTTCRQLDTLLATHLQQHRTPDYHQLAQLVKQNPIETQVWPHLNRTNDQVLVTDVHQRWQQLLSCYPAIEQYKNQLNITSTLLSETFTIYLPLAQFIASQQQTVRRQQNRAFIMGINGGQGSGKSTLSQLLQIILQQGFDLNTANLSIDDVYKTHAQRQAMAKTVHPLFAIRSVAGTHDTTLAMQTLQQLMTSNSTSHIALPRFDKSALNGQGDRVAEKDWPRVSGQVDVVLFEGWLLGAHPQPPAALKHPINQREAKEDPFGIWRHAQNHFLSTTYRELFECIDELLVIQVRHMEDIFHNREKQEQQLRQQLTQIPPWAGQLGNRGAMTKPQVQAFIQLYERTTKHMMATLPNQARTVFFLGGNHRIDRIQARLNPTE